MIIRCLKWHIMFIQFIIFFDQFIIFFELRMLLKLKFYTSEAFNYCH